MRGFSKAIITGNLTRDPELRSTGSGNSVCSFSVAVNRTYRSSDGENKEDVSYIDCSAWGRLGEMIAQYAKKGSGVLVSGRLNQRSWEDKTGNKRSSVEIVVEDFNFAGSAPRDGGGSYSQGSGSTSSASADLPVDMPTDIPDGEVNLDEIPF